MRPLVRASDVSGVRHRILAPQGWGSPRGASSCLKPERSLDKLVTYESEALYSFSGVDLSEAVANAAVETWVCLQVYNAIVS